MFPIRPTCLPPEYEAILTPSRVRRVLWILTKRTGTPFIDDDLTQEALLRAILAFRRPGSIRHPQGLLVKVARDTLADRWRRLSSSGRTVPLDDEYGTHSSPEEAIDRNRRIARVRTALARLNPDRRQLIELHYLHELSISEIVARLGKSRSAVKMGLLRGRRELMRLVL